jgi:uncharacterized protein with GYD domain
MATYVLLTRLSPDAVREPKTIAELGRRVTDKLHAECPEARWLASYAVLGPYDYLDLFEAPDNEAAAKVAVVVRSFGHATTETWPATPWDRFRELLQPMAEAGAGGAAQGAPAGDAVPHDDIGDVVPGDVAAGGPTTEPNVVAPGLGGAGGDETGRAGR